jgi:hypothetical protein
MRNPLIAVHTISEVRRLSPCGRIDCPGLLVSLWQDTPRLPPREGESARLLQMEDFRSLEVGAKVPPSANFGATPAAVRAGMFVMAGRRLKTRGEAPAHSRHFIRVHAVRFPLKLTVRRSASSRARIGRYELTDREWIAIKPMLANTARRSTGERRGARNANHGTIGQAFTVRDGPI